jgi:hypothetical protein
MIAGAHAIIYSKHPEKDKDFLKRILKLTHVDVGHGWLIFGLPPSEIAVHPAEENGQELYFMCDDIKKFVSEMAKQKIACGEIKDQRWGLLSEITLPGGGKLGVYEPRHARPKLMVIKKVTKSKAAAKPKKVAKKKSKAR